VRSSESLVEYEPRNTAAWNAVWERFQRLQLGVWGAGDLSFCECLID